jgi:hypothetical protein
LVFLIFDLSLEACVPFKKTRHSVSNASFGSLKRPLLVEKVNGFLFASGVPSFFGHGFLPDDAAAIDEPRRFVSDAGCGSPVRGCFSPRKSHEPFGS